MKENIKTLIKHPLIAGSSIIFTGSLIANIFNYFFNLSMGRLLTEAEFGLLTALNSLLILVGIFSIAFGNVITKFSAKYFGLGDDQGASDILRIGLRTVFIFSTLILIVLVFSIPFIGTFIRSSNYLFIFLVILSIFFSLILSLPLGFIQGRMRFYLLSGVTIVQPLLRLFVALILIFLGYSLFGPFVGLALSTALPAIVLIIYTYKKYVLPKKTEKVDQKEVRSEFIHYTYTYFLAGIGLTLLSNTDILLVRHFFSPLEAGQYAALSLMGKAIFYFTTPIGTVFFPLIAYKKEKKEALFKTVFLAIGIVVILSAFLSFMYFAFPNLVLAVFFPKEGYKVLSNYLGVYSLYIFVFSLASLFNSYFLSIGKTKVYVLTLIAACSQILLIIYFHSSLFQIIGALFINSLLLLLLFIVYYWKNERA